MGERGGRGDNDDDCGRGGHIVVVIIEQRGQRLGEKGGRGGDVEDDGGRGNCVFVVVIVIVANFGGATPTWRWGRRAVAGMLLRHMERRRRRRATRWCWRGMDPTINIIL